MKISVRVEKFFEYRTNASGTAEAVLQTKAGTGRFRLFLSIYWLGRMIYGES